MKRLWIIAALLACLAREAVAADGGVTHYLMFLAFNGEPDVPSASHTGAVWIEQAGERAPTYLTTSWLPNDGHVRLLALQTGRNYDLAATLGLYQEQRLTTYGPFRVTDAAYRRGLDQRDLLMRGGRYKMYDWKSRLAAPGRADRAINCIHAVSDAIGYLDTGETWGAKATEQVVAFFAGQGAFVDYPRTYPALAPPLR